MASAPAGGGGGGARKRCSDGGKKPTPPPPPPPDDAASSLHQPSPPAPLRRTLPIPRSPHARSSLRRKLSAELDLVRSLSRKLDSHLTSSKTVEKRTPKASHYYGHPDFIFSNSKKKHTSLNTDSQLYAQAFKSCGVLLAKLMKHKFGWVFNKPVDVKGLGLHDYLTLIKRPMDLGTVKSQLNTNWYKSPGEFAEDVRLTFKNAMTYNAPGQDVYAMAEQLSQMFEKAWPAIEAEYACLSQPLSQLGRKTVPVDPRKLERSDSTPAPVKTRPVNHVSNASKMTSSKKPKASEPHKRDMTFEEKQKLSNNLQNLPSEKLDNVVQIIRKRNLMTAQHENEIEVDIDNVDAETLWELDRFVTNYKKSLSKNRKKAEMASQARAKVEENVKEKAVESIQEPVAAGKHKESNTVVEERRQASSSPVGASSSPVGGEREEKSRKLSKSSSSSSGGSSSSESESGSTSGRGSDAHSPKT